MTDNVANFDCAQDLTDEPAGSQGWYAVFCRPRQENRAAWHLRNQNFGLLHPRVRARVRRGGKWQDRVEPLFPRYVFAQPRERGDLGVIRSTRGVVGLVRFGAHVPTVPPDVMAAIAAQLQSDECLRPVRTDDFSPGDPVCVVDGPFAGALARFAGKAAEGRVTVLLELMQRENRVELDPGAIRRA